MESGCEYFTFVYIHVRERKCMRATTSWEQLDGGLRRGDNESAVQFKNKYDFAVWFVATEYKCTLDELKARLREVASMEKVPEEVDTRKSALQKDAASVATIIASCRDGEEAVKRIICYASAYFNARYFNCQYHPDIMQIINHYNKLLNIG